MITALCSPSATRDDPQVVTCRSRRPDRPEAAAAISMSMPSGHAAPSSWSAVRRMDEIGGEYMKREVTATEGFGDCVPPTELLSLLRRPTALILRSGRPPGLPQACRRRRPLWRFRAGWDADGWNVCALAGMPGRRCGAAFRHYFTRGRRRRMAVPGCGLGTGASKKSTAGAVALQRGRYDFHFPEHRDQLLLGLCECALRRRDW